MIKDLLLAPIWHKGAWSDPLYPFPSEGEKLARDVSRIADVALCYRDIALAISIRASARKID
jgi:hypothetical protein